MAGEAHLDPFRTQKLSPRAPMVLRSQSVGEQDAADQQGAFFVWRGSCAKVRLVCVHPDRGACVSELKKKARFDGKEYLLECLVSHAFGGDDIALCRTETGELRYVTAFEWKAASVSHAHDPAPSPKAFEVAPVTQDSSLDEKVALVMSLFRWRADVYAEGYVGKATKPGKLSYWPRCRLRWVRGSCPRLSSPKAR